MGYSKMKLKSAFSFLSSLVLAAAVVFAAGRCPAATFAKASASRGADKNYVTVKWGSVKKAKGAFVLDLGESGDYDVKETLLWY